MDMTENIKVVWKRGVKFDYFKNSLSKGALDVAEHLRGHGDYEASQI